ncbi:MAG: transcriptional repressor [Candidatus Marinimicrobia bacterium]|nr:transcriptional repressor [Candidatus Neomarinimicrobiota bacterium]
MNNIKNLIDDKGVKPTYHRIKILEFLQNNKNHPTADKIYEEIVKYIPTISKTTVYNTLKIFVEKEIIEELTITGNETHYELTEDTGPHHHFYCTQCKTIFDIEAECNQECSKKNDIDGNKVQSYQCYYKGICCNCLRKNNNEMNN